MKVSGLANGDYRILAISTDNNNNNNEVISAEISADIALGENVEYWVKRTEDETDEDELGGLDESGIEIYEKIGADYKVIVDRIKDFYETGSLKSWQARQTLLEKILASYNCSKQGQSEEESLTIESTKEKIRELEADGLIDSSSSQLLLEALDGFL